MCYSFAAQIRKYLCLHERTQRALAYGIGVQPDRLAKMLVKLESGTDLSSEIVCRILEQDFPNNQHVADKRAHAMNMIRWLYDQGYLGRRQVVELLEAAGMPKLSPKIPEEAWLIELLKRKFPRTGPSSSSSLHPFGQLLCRYLSRRPRLSPWKLGETYVEGGGRVILHMIRGQSLGVSRARNRVIQVIDGLCNPRPMGVADKGCLIDLAEANELLKVAGKDGLSYTSEDALSRYNQDERHSHQRENELLDQLIEWTVHFRKRCLSAGKESSRSARILGDIAIDYDRKDAASALWEAICQADSSLPLIVDDCAWTVGRILLETAFPSLEDYCFDILEWSTDREREPIMNRYFSVIVDKFAYTVKRVILEAESEKDEIRKRACRFVDYKTSSRDPEVRAGYHYVRGEVLSFCGH